MRLAFRRKLALAGPVSGLAAPRTSRTTKRGHTQPSGRSATTPPAVRLQPHQSAAEHEIGQPLQAARVPQWVRRGGGFCILIRSCHHVVMSTRAAPIRS